MYCIKYIHNCVLCVSHTFFALMFVFLITNTRLPVSQGSKLWSLIPQELGTKSDCVGGDQQQLTQPTD
jgi:hypothetical protein